MDYLLRDSHHAGVAYGKFDQYRLIDTLRILPSSQDSEEPMLGLDIGGLHSAEALLLARYFMFTQVYCHPVRRIYDIHLVDFLREWLPHGRFPTTVDGIMKYSDIEVLAAMMEASRDSTIPGHEPARRIIERDHFKLAYEKNRTDLDQHLDPGLAVYEALKGEFGEDRLRRDTYIKEGGAIDFPVLDNDRRIVPSLATSDTLEKLPPVAIDNIHIDPSYRDKARRWIAENRKRILA